MALTLHYHPFSRAAGTIWALEEAGVDYELQFVDLMAGKHKTPEFKQVNPMTKLPTLVDGDVVVTEAAAIALYLADRYALDRLAPAPTSPERGTYLRWSLYAPSVIEPGCMAKGANWEVKSGTAGWGRYEDMLDTIEAAIGEGPYLLGERFSMADVIFGGTLRWMLQFDMLEKRPAFTRYVQRLGERPALQKAGEINAAQVKEHGLSQ